jgi:hypothetical protein
MMYFIVIDRDICGKSNENTQHIIICHIIVVYIHIINVGFEAYPAASASGVWSGSVLPYFVVVDFPISTGNNPDPLLSVSHNCIVIPFPSSNRSLGTGQECPVYRPRVRGDDVCRPTATWLEGDSHSHIGDTVGISADIVF